MAGDVVAGDVEEQQVVEAGEEVGEGSPRDFRPLLGLTHVGHVHDVLPVLLYHLVEVLLHLLPLVLAQTLHLLSIDPRCFQGFSQACPAIDALIH